MSILLCGVCVCVCVDLFLSIFRISQDLYLADSITVDLMLSDLIWESDKGNAFFLLLKTETDYPLGVVYMKIPVFCG